MKTLKLVLTSALLGSIAITGVAQADNSLSNLIYDESSNIFADVSYKESTAVGILSYGDDSNKSSVWSTEYEQYVNPGNFEQKEIANIEDVNQYMGRNPTAAGTGSDSVFIYNETAGEYHLQ